MSAARTPVFEVRGLRRTYGEGAAAVHALRGIDLHIDPGELLVLLGPSGSGKSTLLNILGGLDRPTAGSVRFGALEISTASDRELTEYRRHHVGFVFQFYNLIASLTARENVELVTEIADDPMLADDALRLVGLGERLTHFPSQLSGGEQQRVAIARATSRPERSMSPPASGSSNRCSRSTPDSAPPRCSLLTMPTSLASAIGSFVLLMA